MKTITLIFFLLILVSTVFAEKPKETMNITGERMEVLKRGEITRFLGNVRLVKGKDVIVSDLMEHYEKKDYVVGKGNVHFTAYPEESIRLEAFSDQLTYNVQSRDTTLTGNPELIRINEGESQETVKIRGEIIELFGREKKAHVKTGARVEYGGMVALSEILDYDYETRKIVLSGGSPHIYQEDEQVTADYSAEVITIFVDEQRVVMEGNVKAFIHPKKT